jgi:hypothetical protein
VQTILLSASGLTGCHGGGEAAARSPTLITEDDLDAEEIFFYRDADAQ